MDDSGYIVIQFIKSRDFDNNKYFCVPKSWILLYMSDLRVVVKCPLNLADMSDRRLLSGEHDSHSGWAVHSARIKHETDTYDNAMSWISANTPRTVNAAGHQSPIVLKIPKSRISNKKIQFPSTDSHTDTGTNTGTDTGCNVESMEETLISLSKESIAEAPADDGQDLENTPSTTNTLITTEHHPPIIMRIPKSKIFNRNNRSSSRDTDPDGIAETQTDSDIEYMTETPTDSDEENMVETPTDSDEENMAKTTTVSDYTCMPETPTDSDDKNIADIPTTSITAVTNQQLNKKRATPAKSRISSLVDSTEKGLDSDKEDQDIELSLRDLVHEVERRNRLNDGLLPKLTELLSLCGDNNILFEENVDSLNKLKYKGTIKKSEPSNAK